MNSGAESINNFKFLIELSITQFSEFFNLRLLKNSLALAANSRNTKINSLFFVKIKPVVGDNWQTHWSRVSRLDLEVFRWIHRRTHTAFLCAHESTEGLKDSP